MAYKHPYFGNQSKMDPVRNYLYRLEFAATFLDNETLNINASDVSHPSINFTSDIISYLNQDVKFAGRPTLGPMTVVFLSAYNRDAVVEVEKWMTLMYDQETEEMGFAEDYKADCALIILKPNLAVHRSYIMKGCYPENPGDGAFAWANTGHEIRSVTFSIDKALPQGIQG